MASKSSSAQPDVDWQSTKNTVSERTRHMFNNPEMSDISFTCKDSDKTFYAHKYVLATSSVVFHAMFYGHLAEKNSVIHLSDTDEKSLEEFLRFLYTDECDLTQENIISFLYLSKKYIVPSLTEYLIAQLIRDLEPGNVLNILEQAIQFEEKDSENKCWQFIELRANEVIASETFNNISQKTLASLLKRNILNVSEVELFQAVLKWSEFQCSQKSLDLTTENRRSVIGEAVYDLRLIAMGQAEFAKHVSRSGLLSIEELVPIYEEFSKLNESPSLKWTLPNRGKTFDTTKRIIRISRFSTENECSYPWKYEMNKGKKTYPKDSLVFSIDQYALFLGVRLFGTEISYPTNNVTLVINGQTQTVISPGSLYGLHNYNTYKSEQDERGIYGFDVILKSPIFVKKDEVVQMEATISGSASRFGWRGKAKVEVKGITVTFIDCVDNGRTCVSQGQFHEIILSV